MHTMIANGNEFICPICGRRFIVTSWNPFVRVVLEEGGTSAGHTSMTGVEQLATNRALDTARDEE